MGRVFLGYDTRLGRHVAIKFIASAESDVLRMRFLQEARAAARVQHPTS